MFVARRKGRGFTFLEIMFVVVIIGILLALVGPRITQGLYTARNTATQAQIHSIVTAARQFEMDLGRLPKNLGELTTQDSTEPGWKGPYMEETAEPQDAWHRDFNFRVPGEHNKRGFDIWSDGPDKQEGTADDIGNWKASAN